jgi:hypothetical protein
MMRLKSKTAGAGSTAAETVPATPAPAAAAAAAEPVAVSTPAAPAAATAPNASSADATIDSEISRKVRSTASPEGGSASKKKGLTPEELRAIAEKERLSSSMRAVVEEEQDMQFSGAKENMLKELTVLKTISKRDVLDFTENVDEINDEVCAGDLLYVLVVGFGVYNMSKICTRGSGMGCNDEKFLV